MSYHPQYPATSDQPPRSNQVTLFSQAREVLLLLHKPLKVPVMSGYPQHPAKSDQHPQSNQVTPSSLFPAVSYSNE